MKGRKGNQEGTLTGEERVTEKAGGTRDGRHNKNSKIQRMCSDLIGLQGLSLGQAQTAKCVPKSKSPSIPESSGYWEHKMRLGMLVLSMVPWDADENLADLPATLTTCQGLS